MHNQIGTEGNRLLQIRGDEGGINHQRQIGTVRHLGQCRNIADLQSRIANALGIDEAGLGLDRGLEAFDVMGMHKGRGDPEARQGMGEQIVRTAIEGMG